MALHSIIMYLNLNLSKSIPFKTSNSAPSTSRDKKSIKLGAAAANNIELSVTLLAPKTNDDSPLIFFVSLCYKLIMISDI